MQADDDMYNADTAFEEENGSSRSRRRRSSIKKAKREVLSLAPNLGLLLLFYACFYSFLCGLYLLLLKGVTSTRVGGQETLLWAFFYLGVAFILVVSAATYASKWEKTTQEQASSASGRSIVRSRSSSLGESECRVLMNEPPPPPSAAESRITTADDDLEDVELVSAAKSTTASLRSSIDSRHIGDVDVS